MENVFINPKQSYNHERQQMLQMFSALLVFLATFISLCQGQSFPVFTSPLNGSIIEIGDLVPVTVSYDVSMPITIYQNCDYTISLPSSTNQTAMFPPPANPGNCTYTATVPQGALEPESVYATFVGSVQIVFPYTDDTIGAGTSITVLLLYTPIVSTAYNFLVTLNCPESGLPEVNQTAQGIDPLIFNIPQDFSGRCQFNVSDPADLYIAKNSVDVFVTNVYSILQPTNGETVEYPNSFYTLIDTDTPNIQSNVNMTLNCTLGSRTFYVQADFPSNITPLNYEVGNCSFYITNSPQELVYLSIRPSVIFVEAPTVIYDKLTFKVQLNTTAALTPEIQTVGLQLNCTGTIFESWNANLNQETELTLSADVPSMSNCVLDVPPGQYLFNYVSTPVSIANPYIVRPVNGSNHYYNENVFFKLNNASNYKDAVAIQQCGNDLQVAILNSTYETIFTINDNTAKECTYSVSMTPSPEVKPVRVNVVDKVVGFTMPVYTSPPSSYAAGSSISIQLYYSPTTTPDTVFTVQLGCGTNTTTLDVTGGADPVPMVIPNDYYGVDCLLSIVDLTDGYVEAHPIPLIVTQSLKFSTPLPYQKFVVSGPVTFFLTTGYVNLYDQVGVKVQCSEADDILALQTNILSTETFNYTFRGICNVSVSSAPAYYSLPDPFSIEIKYKLAFTQSPRVIIGGIPFGIELTATPTPNPSVTNTTDVSLVCKNNATIYTWYQVEIGKLEILTLPPDVKTYQKCVLMTPSDSSYYHAIAILNAIRSPFGGFVYPISQEQASQFAKSIAFLPISIFYTLP